MKIADLFLVQRLEARRRRLITLRARPNLRARIGGIEIGEAADDVDEEVIQQLLPIVDLHLAQQIDAIESELRGLGVELG